MLVAKNGPIKFDCPGCNGTDVGKIVRVFEIWMLCLQSLATAIEQGVAVVDARAHTLFVLQEPPACTATRGAAPFLKFANAARAVRQNYKQSRRLQICFLLNFFLNKYPGARRILP